MGTTQRGQERTRATACSDSALSSVAARPRVLRARVTSPGSIFAPSPRLHAGANRFAVDGVLKPLQDSLQPLDPLLQGLDRPRVSGRGVVGWRLRLRCLAAAQLNDPLQRSGEAARSPGCGPFGYEGPSIQANFRVGSRLTSSTRPATTSRSQLSGTRGDATHPVHHVSLGVAFRRFQARRFGALGAESGDLHLEPWHSAAKPPARPVACDPNNRDARCLGRYGLRSRALRSRRATSW
jgi:hypothetical protein